MPSFDSLGDRMKHYEGLRGRQLMPLLPAVVRLDGRAFHSFTRGMAKPFDLGLIDLMIETTKHLVEETNARIGYTQSDEITLVLKCDDHKTQMYFDGRVDKINSVLAAICSTYFVRHLGRYLSDKAGASPVFDCRCFNVPSEAEAVNVLVWREQDATRNSIQMVGQANFSHKELMNRSCAEIQEMLWQQKGINWNDFQPKCKRGTYVRRRRVSTPFTAEEIDSLPEKHEARRDPSLVVERAVMDTLDLPPITRVVNMSEVVFHGITPMPKPESCE